MTKNDDTDEMLNLFLGDSELEEAEDSNVKVFHVSMNPDKPSAKKSYVKVSSPFISIKTGLLCIGASCGVGVLLGIVILIPLGVM